MILTVVEYPQKTVHKLSWDVIPHVGHLVLLRTGLPTITRPNPRLTYEVLAVVWDGGASPYVIVTLVSSPYADLIADMG
jgi:hypothetical protein